MQFINIALIVLLINFNAVQVREFIKENLSNSDRKGLFGFLPILNGDYKDFSVKWYQNVGSILAVTMMLNIVSPHGSLLASPFFQLVSRCWDRRCRCNIKLKNDSNNRDNDEVNTKQELQSELQNLYTGYQIRAHYVYAQIYTTVWACLMYSSGIPVLYPLGCLFFTGMYWMCKYLFIHYFQRSTRFNHNLQLFSLSYMKYGALFHMIIGCIIYTNSRIFSSQAKEEFIKEFDIVLKRLNNIEFFDGRFRTTHTQLYLAVLIFIVILYCLKRFVFRKLDIFFKTVLLCGFCRKKQARLELTRDFFTLSDNIYKELDLYSLQELYKRATFDLNSFKKLIEDPNNL